MRGKTICEFSANSHLHVNRPVYMQVPVYSYRGDFSIDPGPGSRHTGLRICIYTSIYCRFQIFPNDLIYGSTAQLHKLMLEFKRKYLPYHVDENMVASRGSIGDRQFLFP